MVEKRLPSGVFVARNWESALPPREEGFNGKIAVFLVSTSDYRTNALRMALDRLGLSDVRPLIVPGPPVESGDTSIDRAVHKVVTAAMTADHDGYFRRHPNQLTLFLAADSRTYVNGQAKDKPQSEEMFGMHAEDWERALHGEHRLIERSGYAALSLNGKATLMTLEDVMTHVPYRRSFIRETFELSRFSDQRKYAHSVNSPEAILGGHVESRLLNGEILLPEVAAHRAMGASVDHMEQLISSLMPASV